MTRRLFLGATASAAATFAQTRRNKPNVVVIVADDLGYGEIGVQGTEVPTPNIDALAKGGVRFTNGYVSCPVCSPTRAGLMTGRYQQRFGHELNPGPAQNSDPNFGLPLDQTTLANRMTSLGYATGMVGKWHLGYQPQYHPMKRGFDEFFGFLGGAHSYIDSRADKANPIYRGTTPVEEPEYLTDAFMREAARFIDSKANQPFFLYLTFNAVHNPLQGAKYLDRFKNVTDEKRRHFSAMLSALDDGVGRVVTALRNSRLEENTLIVFISDNGGPTPATTAGNGPLHGFKGQVYEGGIRVPYIMQWKGRIPAGKTYDKPVISLDILPTAVAAAGGPAPTGIDGVDLLPFLTGKNSGTPHDELHWRFGPQWAVRKGDWKLLKTAQGSVELYDLKSDIGEKKDLAASAAPKLKELQASHDAWNAQLIPPKWKTERQAAPGPERKALRKKKQ
ncbi:MAG: sulfatase-like hydrolase/transferase [Bryobacteraceae bacterium]|nr:sulfatase-like hydrolase/transferase [Bryobacteraceae bacterium]